MKTKAKVLSANGQRAVVEVERVSACEGCHKNTDGNGCSVCTLMGGKRKFTATAENKLGAKEGDIVTVETESGRVLWYAALVFLLPLVCAALAWAIASLCRATAPIQAGAAIGGFVICFIGLFLYSKILSRSRCDVRIIEIVKTE